MSEHEHSHDFGPLEYFYYAPNEIMLHFEHDPQWLGGGELTTEHVYDLLTQREYMPDNMREKGAFDLTNKGTTFVLPPVESEAEDANSKMNHSVFLLKTTKSGALNVARTINDFTALHSGLNAIGDENKGGVRIDDSNGNVGIFRRVLPNWYLGASPHIGLGAHGPGRKPRPVPDDYQPELRKFQVAPEFENAVTAAKAAASASRTAAPTSKTTPPEVDVFILDTIPKLSRLTSALTNFPGLDRYKLILEKKNVPAQIGRYFTEKAEYIYASAIGQNFNQTNDPHDPAHYHPIILAGHDYDSSDHGLFIAGIIHDIVPEAQLYVIEIMNERGIGTFWNIAAGFREALRIHQTRSANQYIINCSLTLAFPTIGQYGYTPDFTDVGLFDFLDLFMNTGVQIPAPIDLLVNQMDSAQLQAIRDAIQRLVDGTTELFQEVMDNIHNGALIVAAAGNDSDRSLGDIRETRYLAKTKQATGVGALNKNGDIASYSNKADEQSIDGFFAFGGDYSDQGSWVDEEGRTHYPDTGQGVISIFLAPFENECNLNGYAEWAGTSFAAPVLAATIAKASIESSDIPKIAKEAVVRAASPNQVENISKLTTVDQL